MPSEAKHDPDAGHEPEFAAPKNACDAHFHVFGEEKRYPYDAHDLRYKPPYEPLDAYMKLARRLGFERFVFVQPSAYGLDNSCMLDAMAEVAPEVRRGIIHLDETKPTDAALEKWHAQGVRGVRINVSPVRKAESGFADHLRPKIVRSAAICRELGWHLDFLMPGWLISEVLGTLGTLPVAFSVAHRILNACNDRSLNLQLYKADPLRTNVTNGGSGYDAAAPPLVTISGGTGTYAPPRQQSLLLALFPGVLPKSPLLATELQSRNSSNCNHCSSAGVQLLLPQLSLGRKSRWLTPSPTRRSRPGRGTGAMAAFQIRWPRVRTGSRSATKPGSWQSSR